MASLYTQAATILAMWPGTVQIQAAKPILWAKNSQTNWAFTT